MNLSLQDPYTLALDSPEIPTHELSRNMEDVGNTPRLTKPGSGHATTLRFNRKGDYLASGRADGKVIIW